MRDKNDPGSVEMFPGTKRGRGRPRVESPLSGAERAARYREKQATLQRASEGVVADLSKEVRRLQRLLTQATKKRSVTKNGR